MRVVVPYDPREPKTRLAGALTADERRAFADVMLLDVLEVVRDAGGDPEILSTADIDVDEVPVTVDTRPLTRAINARLTATDEPLSVLMADLPLATAAAVESLFESTGDVVIAPGLGGGTNGLVVRHPEFAVDYHGASYLDHRETASSLGASVATIDSFHLGIDVDEPEDLAEVLLHGSGRAAAWLRKAGFRVHSKNGRVSVEREKPSPIPEIQSVDNV